MKRSLLFYSAWPLGYHNVEAERKAVAFAAAGYDVVYVAGIGIRNPRPSSVGKAIDRLRRATRRVAARAHPAGLREAGLAVVPPRQVPLVRTFNRSLVEGRLRQAVNRWPDAVAWVRWPTPELVDALERLQPALIVYEVVDPYHLTPGITGRWQDRHARAERRLVDLADVVVTTGDVLADRYQAMGADVRVVPHGVDLFAWSPRPPRDRTCVGFIGTLDYRIDEEAVRAVAQARPAWQVRFIGPVQEGFRADAYGDLPNVSIEPPVPHEDLGTTLGELDVGFLAYRDSPMNRLLTPVKPLELLAAGRPVVARRLPALERLGDDIGLVDHPDAFVAAIEAALADDSPERAAQRRRLAEHHTWEKRLAELTALIDELLA